MSGFTVHSSPLYLPFPYTALPCDLPLQLSNQAFVYYFLVSNSNKILRELCFNHQQLWRSIQETGVLKRSGSYPASRNRLDSRNIHSVWIFSGETHSTISPQRNSVHLLFVSDLLQILVLHLSIIFLRKPSYQSPHLYVSLLLTFSLKLNSHPLTSPNYS